MNNDNKCCQCGATTHLFKLECGKFSCLNCLDEIAQEQKEIKEYIEDYLIENFQISNPNTRAKTLQSIALQILMENNLLSSDLKRKIDKISKEMTNVE